MGSGALVDAHVHFYSAYNAQRFLDAASDGFGRHPEKAARRVLCMAESAADNWFGRLTETDRLAGTGWELQTTKEPQSLLLHRTADGAELIVIAGHQCVTREDIEVLMLGLAAKYPDGEPAEQVVKAALAGGALPLLPWGFGKWFGERGELVRRLMTQFGSQLLLGDNSGRLAGTPIPALLKEGAAAGHCLLPGSDPLPMQGEERKVASFGAFIPGELSCTTPFADLKALVSSAEQPVPYGAGESPVRFLRNQVLMQVRKRWPARG